MSDTDIHNSSHSPHNPVRREKDMDNHRIEAISSFSAHLAHEFGNIFAALEGYTDLCEKRHQELNECIAAISRMVEKGCVLTKKLSLLAGGVPLKMEYVNTTAAIDRIKQTLLLTLPKGTKVLTLPDQNTPYILAEEELLTMGLLGICRMTDRVAKDGCTVVITTKLESTNESSEHGSNSRPDSVIISISMSEPERLHLFHPSVTRTAMRGGGDWEDGFELAVAAAIVHRYQGSINVKSIPGGTGVYLRIPSAGDLKKSREKMKSGVAKSILVVEDHKSYRDVLSSILESDDYQVLIASNGVEGLESYSRNRKHIDLIVSDIDMPEMNGREMLGALREFDPNVNIMFLTGLDKRHPDVASLLKHQYTVLPKSTGSEEILRTIQKMFSRKHEDPGLVAAYG